MRGKRAMCQRIIQKTNKKNINTPKTYTGKSKNNRFKSKLGKTRKMEKNRGSSS